MNKYVIDTTLDNVKKVIAMGVTKRGAIWTDTTDIENLEELNSDYINEHYGELQDTAYQKGLEEGKKAFDLLESERNSEYQRGLSDGNDIGYKDGVKDGRNEAWEAAKKLFSSMADSDIEKAFPIEWNNGGFKALMNLQPQEAISKLKAYDDKQKDRIEVGDEVIWKTENITLIVTSTYETSGFNWCDGVAQDGKVYHTLTENDRKTGKHYDIASILEAMRE